MPRRRRSQYVLYGSEGDEVAYVQAHVPAAVGRRRAAGVAAAAAAGVLGIPIVGAVGAAALALAAASVPGSSATGWTRSTPRPS